MSTRQKRVEELVLQTLRQLFLFEVENPRLAGIEITHVETTPDLKTAYVNYVIEKADAEVKKALEKISGFLRRRLSQEVKLRYAIDVKFFYDEGWEKRMTVEKILNELEQDGRISPSR